MTRDNLLFAIIGILVGFILGFLLASSTLQREAALRAAPAATQNLPPNHPPVGAGNQTGDPQQTFTQVQEAMKQAREQPDNFEAHAFLADALDQLGDPKAAANERDRAESLKRTSKQ